LRESKNREKIGKELARANKNLRIFAEYARRKKTMKAVTAGKFDGFLLAFLFAKNCCLRRLAMSVKLVFTSRLVVLSGLKGPGVWGIARSFPVF
jgi:hypothetical protein